MPAEHQRVFFIEEKACRTPESFLYRGKGLPDASRQTQRGSFLPWKRNPIRTRAPEALANGTFFVPLAHIDRLVRRIFSRQQQPEASSSNEGLAVLPRSLDNYPDWVSDSLFVICRADLFGSTQDD